jgi:hypothetical protein
MEEFMGKLVLGVAALALSAGAASAQQWVYPGYGYAPYGYGYPSYGYGYAATGPLYDYAGAGYAAPAYGAPATAGTTVIIVNPAPAYSAPVVGSGYYNYAPGYGRTGYWGGYGYGWR